MNSIVRTYVAGFRSSYDDVNYEQFVNQHLTPYISAARNVAMATTAAAAVVIVTVVIARLLGRAWLRRLHRMFKKNNQLNALAVDGNIIDDSRFQGHLGDLCHLEGHLDDLCECHMTSAVTSPSAGFLMQPCNYSETIV